MGDFNTCRLLPTVWVHAGLGVAAPELALPDRLTFSAFPSSRPSALRRGKAGLRGELAHSSSSYFHRER